MFNKKNVCLGCGSPKNVFLSFCVNCLNKSNYKEEQRTQFEASINCYEDFEESCRDYEYEEEYEE